MLYLTNTHWSQDPTELLFVDCGGETCAPPVRVNEPLAPDTTIFFHTTTMRSPKRRWLVYDVGGPGAVGVERWVLRLDGPTMGAPRRVQMPPISRFEWPQFGGAEDEVMAFRVELEEGVSALWLCRLADDGACAPTQWSPELKYNNAGVEVAVSPDGAWVAYAGMRQAGEALGVESVRDAHLCGDLWTIAHGGVVHVFRCGLAGHELETSTAISTAV